MERRERVFVAVDVSNLWYSCREEFGQTARLDFMAIAKLVPTLLHPKAVDQAITAYVVSHARANATAFIHTLNGFGYEVRERRMSYDKVTRNAGKPGRTDWDVGITIDAIDRMPEYDTFVLMSGDGDFGQLLDYLRVCGKKTVAFSFNVSLAQRLYHSANKVMSLDKSVVYQAQSFSRVWST